MKLSIASRTTSLAVRSARRQAARKSRLVSWETRTSIISVFLEGQAGSLVTHVSST